MSTLLWTPGAAGPLDEWVKRVVRMAEAFAAEHGLEQAELRLELVDGSQHVLASLSADPGLGFLSFDAHPRQGGEPRRLVVPIGAVKSLELSAPDPERPFGFATGDV